MTDDASAYEAEIIQGRRDDQYAELVAFVKAGNRKDHDDLARMLGVPERDLDDLWNQTRARLHLSTSGVAIDLQRPSVTRVDVPESEGEITDVVVTIGRAIDRVSGEDRVSLARLVTEELASDLSNRDALRVYVESFELSRSCADELFSSAAIGFNAFREAVERMVVEALKLLRDASRDRETRR